MSVRETQEENLKNTGKQYALDDKFKKQARLHQSKYRDDVLQVGYDEYGNRLTEPDAKALLNYYDGLNVRNVLRDRYPSFSKARDGDMLRSEHISFNMFAPLCADRYLTKRIIKQAFGIVSEAPYFIEIEFAPKPKQNYLDDATAFDTYIAFTNSQGKKMGIGIETKYTEGAYPIGETEKKRVEDQESKYWHVTRQSAAFIDPANSKLGEDDLRQIWRNHLLGLSMCQNNDLDDFYSITLYPEGNSHFKDAMENYQALLTKPWRKKVFGCTFEKYIQGISGDKEIMEWKQYLSDRYLIKNQ